MSSSTAITDRRVSRTALGFILSLIIHALIASGLYFFFTAQTPAPEPTTPHLALSLAIFQPATPPPPTPDNIQALAAAQQLATQQALAREQQRRDAERRKQARLQREREKQQQEQTRIEKQRLEQQRLEKQRREQQQREQHAQQQARELAAQAAKMQAEREAAQRAEQARIAQAQADANKTDKANKAANTRTQAFYRYKIEPKYPRKARQRGLEGTAIIQVAINIQGRVTKATIYKSSGHRLLDKAALKAVKQYRFEPHRVNGVAVAGTAEVPVRFELK